MAVRLACIVVALASASFDPAAQAQAAAAPAMTSSLRTGEEIVSLESRPGVTTRILVAAPAGQPRGIFLLFPGGAGRVLLPDDRVIRAGFGRAGVPHIAAQGFVAIAIDVPSDHAGGLPDDMRISSAHVQDARKVVEYAGGRWPGVPIFLLGHSSGAISVAHLAASLEVDRLGAVVLVASPTKRGGPVQKMLNVPDVPLARIKVPALVVHHRDDACAPTLFREARWLPRLFTASSRVALLEVRGGETLASDPCAGSWTPHDLYGMEAQAAEAIGKWVLGGQIPERIGP